MHPQTAGAPQLTRRSNVSHAAESVDIAAVSLSQPRLRLLIMVSGNSSRRTRWSGQPDRPTQGQTPTANPASTAVASAIGVIDPACPGLREE
jgi:hypothetical protein